MVKVIAAAPCVSISPQVFWAMTYVACLYCDFDTYCISVQGAEYHPADVEDWGCKYCMYIQIIHTYARFTFCGVRSPGGETSFSLFTALSALGSLRVSCLSTL